MKQVVFYGLVCLLCGCRPRAYKSDEGKVFGTYFHVTYDSEQDYGTAIRAEMERVNQSLSMFNPRSVISKLNRNESEETDSLFLLMFGKAKEVFLHTGGAFDITVAPLVNAWGFGFKQRQLPDSTRVDSMLRFVGMEKLRLESGRLLKAMPEVMMDASALAKGLGVDVVADFFDRKGVTNYMVEIGGEVRAKGLSLKQRAWRIGIDKPVDDATGGQREIALVVNLEKGALATSGNYRNFYVIDGKKYAHTINPRTGFPVQRDILSASVYASSCMEADAYATAFMVLGLKASQEVLQKLSGVEACFIYENEKKEREIWMSDGFKKLVEKK